MSEEMKEFLQWMVTGHPGNSNLVKSLDDAVQKARDHEAEIPDSVVEQEEKESIN